MVCSRHRNVYVEHRNRWNSEASGKCRQTFIFNRKYCISVSNEVEIPSGGWEIVLLVSMGVINPIEERVMGLINPIVKKVLGLSPRGAGFIPDPNKAILKTAFFDVLCALKINPKRDSRVLATFLQKSTYCLLKNAMWGLGLRKNTVFFACSQKPKNVKKQRVFF